MNPRSLRLPFFIGPVLLLLLVTIAISCTSRGGSASGHSGDSPTLPLHRAAADGNVDLLQKLLSVDGSVGSKDRHEWTALHWAAIEGKVETAGLLLDRGADPNARGQFDMTPLHWAAMKGHADVAALLTRRGGRTDVRNVYGRTPLHDAANVPLVDQLLSAGAALETRDDWGMTPLQTARGGLIAKRLIRAGADPRIVAYDGRSALQIAVVESLDSHGISIQAHASPLRIRGDTGRGSMTFRSTTAHVFEDLKVSATSPGCTLEILPNALRLEPGQVVDFALTLTRLQQVPDGVSFVYFTATEHGKELGRFELKVDTARTETPEDRGMIRLGSASVRKAPSRWSYVVYALVPGLVVAAWALARRRATRNAQAGRRET